MNHSKIALFVILFACSFKLSAGAAEFHPVASIGYDMGGATVMDVTYVSMNGRPINIKEKITGGDGLTLSVGFYAPLAEDIGLQAAVGMKSDGLNDINSYMGLSRVPYDVLAYLHLDENHSVALGRTYHTQTKFTCQTTDPTAIGCNSEDKFNDAWGTIAEYNYAVGAADEGGLKIGLRFTSIKYTLSNVDVSFDGTSVGLIFYVY